METWVSGCLPGEEAPRAPEALALSQKYKQEKALPGEDMGTLEEWGLSSEMSTA